VGEKHPAAPAPTALHMRRAFYQRTKHGQYGRRRRQSKTERKWQRIWEREGAPSEVANPRAGCRPSQRWAQVLYVLRWMARTVRGRLAHRASCLVYTCSADSAGATSTGAPVYRGPEGRLGYDSFGLAGGRGKNAALKGGRGIPSRVIGRAGNLVSIRAHDLKAARLGGSTGHREFSTISPSTTVTRSGASS